MSCTPRWPSCRRSSGRLVVLVELYGYPVSEAAERLGIAVGTVKSRGSRARVRLQQIMRALQPAAEER